MNPKENTIIQMASSDCTASSCHETGICWYSEKVSVAIEGVRTKEISAKNAGDSISTGTLKARSTNCGNINVVYRKGFSQLGLTRTKLGAYVHADRVNWSSGSNSKI